MAPKDHGHEMPLQLCQAEGSQGDSKGREEDEEADCGQGVSELWFEDAGRAAGGGDDLVHDCRRGDVGETRDTDGAVALLGIKMYFYILILLIYYF